MARITYAACVRTWRTLALLALLTWLFIPRSIAEPPPTRWSIANGDWFTPTTWSPTGVPTSNDRVLVSHRVTVNRPSGTTTLSMVRLRVTASGSLTAGGADLGLAPVDLVVETTQDTRYWEPWARRAAWTARAR
jgi:hypothetical protein